MKFFTFFLVSIISLSAVAYKNSGFERVNPDNIIKKATKQGLVIPSKEKIVKRDLTTLKKKKPKEFEAKVKNGIENPAFYQGYLLEVQDGLDKVQKAKNIAKFVLYEKVENNWDVLKLTVLNSVSESRFARFKSVLISQLQDIIYIGQRQGYRFEVGQWGYATVSNNLSAVTWQIEFATKGDNNPLEEGAENIQIEGGSQTSPANDDLGF